MKFLIIASANLINTQITAQLRPQVKPQNITQAKAITTTKAKSPLPAKPIIKAETKTISKTEVQTKKSKSIDGALKSLRHYTPIIAKNLALITNDQNLIITLIHTLIDEKDLLDNIIDLVTGILAQVGSDISSLNISKLLIAVGNVIGEEPGLVKNIKHIIQQVLAQNPQIYSLLGDFLYLNKKLTDGLESSVLEISTELSKNSGAINKLLEVVSDIADSNNDFLTKVIVVYKEVQEGTFKPSPYCLEVIKDNTKLNSLGRRALYALTKKSRV